jgi:hypothetical protein
LGLGGASITKIYLLLAKYRIVNSIDDFLNLNFAQTELFLLNLQEMIKEAQGFF